MCNERSGIACSYLVCFCPHAPFFLRLAVAGAIGNEIGRLADIPLRTNDDCRLLLPDLVGLERGLDILVQEVRQDDVANSSIVFRLVSHGGQLCIKDTGVEK